MEKTEKKQILTQEDIIKVLEICYEKALQGIPRISTSIEQLALEYIGKYSTKDEACKAMVKNQVIKCTTTGVVTSLGGFITLPVALSADVTGALYVQIRMIACVAYMAGLDLNSDETQTFVYACLAGVAINEVLKNAGIKVGVKLANGLIKKIPGKVLTKINQKVGFRLITKFGTKGIINLGRLVPVVGAVIGGTANLIETRTIGKRAYKWFFEGNYNSGRKEDVISLDDADFDEIREANYEK